MTFDKALKAIQQAAAHKQEIFKTVELYRERAGGVLDAVGREDGDDQEHYSEWVEYFTDLLSSAGAYIDGVRGPTIQFRFSGEGLGGRNDLGGELDFLENVISDLDVESFDDLETVLVMLRIVAIAIWQEADVLDPDFSVPRFVREAKLQVGEYCQQDLPKFIRVMNYYVKESVYA